MKFLPRILSVIVSVVLCAQTASAMDHEAWLPSRVKKAWGANSLLRLKAGKGSIGDFVQDGSIGAGKPVGFYEDEYGIGAVIAVEVTEHGGKFCPRSLHCANRGCKDWSNLFVHYSENHINIDPTSCVWLCEPGYSGAGCKDVVTLNADDTVLDPKAGGVFSNIGVIQDRDQYYNRLSTPVFGFWQKDKRGYAGADWDDLDVAVVLGAIKFLEHGILAAPVRLECYQDCWSYIKEAYVPDGAKTKLLCAAGYTSNSGKTDCIPLTPDLIEKDAFLRQNAGKKFCSGWDEAQFSMEIHELILDEKADCVKFLCKDRLKAFPAKGSFACDDCSTSIRGGQSAKTGLCIQCDRAGQYFDTDADECALADAFTVTDLKYGRNKTENDMKNLSEQCWTKVVPSEYISCVTGGGNSGGLVVVPIDDNQGPIIIPVGPGGGNGGNSGGGTSGGGSSGGGGGGTSGGGGGGGDGKPLNLKTADDANMQVI